MSRTAWKLHLAWPRGMYFQVVKKGDLKSSHNKGEKKNHFSYFCHWYEMMDGYETHGRDHFTIYVSQFYFSKTGGGKKMIC